MHPTLMGASCTGANLPQVIFHAPQVLTHIVLTDLDTAT